MLRFFIPDRTIPPAASREHVSDGPNGDAFGCIRWAVWQGLNRDLWLDPGAGSAGDEYRAGAAIDDVIRNAAQQESAGAIQGPCADDDEVGIFGLGRGDDALPRLAGPHQERRFHTVNPRLLNDRLKRALALGAELVQPRRSGGNQLASEAKAQINDVDHEQPGAKRSTQVYRLFRGAFRDC